VLRKFFNRIRSVVSYLQFDRSQRRLTFYSEGRNYWPHLQGLIEQVLEQSDLPICYLSSADDDPGLQFEHPRFHTFLIDEGAIRNWLFANIETDVMVMTMPDIEQYQVKRSSYPVHYVYVQHSLVSLHMVYRPGAFDHYDTVFCAGPHHVAELRALEANAGLAAKAVFEHGYSRLDAIRREAATRSPVSSSADDARHVLFAPSWGETGIIESGLGQTLVADLIADGHQVTLRPHPQTIRFWGPKVDAICVEHANNPRFTFEANVDGQESLQQSDLMISDWSGAALEYAFGLNKPVVFVDVPRKVNNPDYEQIPLTPLEVSIRSQIGHVFHPDDGKLQLGAITFDIAPPEQFVFNLDNSDVAGARELVSLVKKVSETKN